MKTANQHAKEIFNRIAYQTKTRLAIKKRVAKVGLALALSSVIVPAIVYSSAGLRGRNAPPSHDFIQESDPSLPSNEREEILP